MTTTPSNDLAVLIVSGGMDSSVLAHYYASAGFDLATRRYQTTHDLLIRKFSASVRDNTPAPVPPEDGRESIRVLDLLMEDLEKDSS